MAAPHAAGVAALMLSYIKTFNPEANVHDIYEILRTTTTSVEGIFAGREGQFDQLGVIDAYNAIETLSEFSVESRASFLPDDTHCRNEVRLVVATDDKGYETAYRLKRVDDGAGEEDIWMKKPNSLDSNTEYNELFCMDGHEDDCFRFDIRDMGGDGIAGSGIALSYGSHTLYEGGSFGKGGMLKFGNC
jgi:hypothetical protein